MLNGKGSTSLDLEVKMKRNNINKFVTTLITAIMLVAAAPLQILAQTSNSGVITGVVKDQAGAVVAGATVKAINKGTNLERKPTTSDSGVYEIPQLTPGEYRLEVEAGGFAKYVQETVTVNVLSQIGRASVGK